MQSTTLILLLGLMATAAFFFGRGRSLALVGGPGHSRELHSLPGYYGYYVSIWCILPALALVQLSSRPMKCPKHLLSPTSSNDVV